MTNNSKWSCHRPGKDKLRFPLILPLYLEYYFLRFLSLLTLLLRCLKLYIVLYRNTMKNIKILLNKICYTYTALIPNNIMLSLLNKCKFWFKCVSWTKYWGRMHGLSLNILATVLVKISIEYFFFWSHMKLSSEKMMTDWKNSVRTTGYCISKQKSEVPRDVRNSKVRKQDKFRRDWSQH